MITISALTRECESKFDAILVAVGSSNHASREIGIRDERARFRVWAANLGAGQPAHSATSLDHRLRDGPRMKDSVMSNLMRLWDVCDRVIPILSGDLPNRIEPVSEAAGNLESTNELEQLSLNVKSAINSLFALSILIRRQRPKGRLPGMNDFVPFENSPDIMHVKDKFPKTKKAAWLAQRLGNAITQRRIVLQYRQLHRKRLAIGREEAEPAKASTADAATVSDATSGTIATTFHEGPEGEAGQNSTSDQRSIYTSATSFITTYGEEDEMGRRIPDLPDLVLDGAQLSYGEPFECPYCRTIQSVTNRFEWKRHVFADLQPYVCTFADCSEGLFSTRHEWFRHENIVHRRQWHCIYCSNATPAFKNEADIEGHIKIKHEGMVTEAQLPLILEACERSLQDFGTSSCPLCDEWTPPSTTTRSAKEFCRHVARHLQLLSVSSMPLAIEGLEDRSHASEAKSASDSGDLEEQADAQSFDTYDRANFRRHQLEVDEDTDSTNDSLPDRLRFEWFQVRAVENYEAQDSDEKSFKRGYIFTVRDTIRNPGHFYVLKQGPQGQRRPPQFVPVKSFELVSHLESEKPGIEENVTNSEARRSRVSSTLSRIGSYLGASRKDSKDAGSSRMWTEGRATDFPEIPGEETRSPNLSRIRQQYIDFERGKLEDGHIPGPQSLAASTRNHWHLNPESLSYGEPEAGSSAPGDNTPTTPAVPFGSTVEEIFEPERSPTSAFRNQTPRRSDEVSAEELKELSKSLQNSNLQERRMSVFTFEPFSLPPSRTPSYTEEPRDPS